MDENTEYCAIVAFTKDNDPTWRRTSSSSMLSGLPTVSTMIWS